MPLATTLAGRLNDFEVAQGMDPTCAHILWAITTVYTAVVAVFL